MGIFITDVDGVTVMRPSGRLDAPRTREFEGALLGTGQTASRLLFDFSRVTYAASGALRVVLKTAKDFTATGRPLAVCGLGPGVEEVFRMAGLDTVLDIHDDRDEALRTLAGKTAKPPWRA